MSHKHVVLPPRALAAASGLTLGALAAALILAGCSSNPAGPGPPRTFLVDPGGSGDFTTIQAGLNAASDGDTVLVVPGTYIGDGNKNLTFGGMSPLLRGTGERDEVIIDCEGEGRGFFIDSRESPTIENLTVTNGDMPRGGGMYINGDDDAPGATAPALSNVRFVENEANVEAGGGIYCRYAAPALVDVLFDDNTAAYEGGGMHCAYSSPALESVVFLGNEARVSGGALSCVFSPPTVSQCVFFKNISPYGGALFCNASAPSINRCTFADNDGLYGSAICCWSQSTPTITNTIVAFNGPDEGLYCDISLPTTNLSCFYENGEVNELCGNYTTSMIYENPQFCDLEGGDLTLAADSPCLPDNNQWGIQMGALVQGCK
jgi:predicted outer membrane repeat protein